MSRRNVILSMGIGIWHKPIINSIVLPAHAQTSSLNSVTGKWLFNGSGHVNEEIELLENGDFYYRGHLVEFNGFDEQRGWGFYPDGDFYIDIQSPKAPWVGFVSYSRGLAQRIEITRGFDVEPPITWLRE